MPAGDARAATRRVFVPARGLEERYALLQRPGTAATVGALVGAAPQQVEASKVARANCAFGAVHLAVLVVFLIAVQVTSDDGVEPATLFPVRLTVTRVFLGDAWRRGLSNCTLGQCLVGGAGAFAAIDAAHADLEDRCTARELVTNQLFAGVVPSGLPSVPMLYFACFIQCYTALCHFLEVGRWHEYSITASLMITCIASLGRITDAYTHLGLFMMTVATMLCGAAAEEANDRDGGSAGYGWFWTGAAFFLCTWAVIITNFRDFVTAFDDDAMRKFWVGLLGSDALFNDAAVAESSTNSWVIPAFVKFAIYVPCTLFCFYPCYTAWSMGMLERCGYPGGNGPSAKRALVYMWLSLACKLALIVLIAYGMITAAPVTRLSDCAQAGTDPVGAWSVAVVLGLGAALVWAWFGEKTAWHSWKKTAAESP
jgi:hypothetical protein